MKLPGIARTAVINALLQGLTLLSKATMMFGLAKYLPVDEFGRFGLFFATINLAMFAVGLDFNSFSAREILKAPAEVVPRLLRNQLALHLVTYPIAAPVVLLLVFWFGTRSWSFVGWFCVLLVLEHLGQEVQRILVTLQRSSLAALMLFVRQGMWGLTVPLAMVVYTDSRNLETVLVGWSVCGAAGLMLGVFCLRDLAWRSSLAHAVDWPWIRTGLRRAMPFLAATLALTAMRTIDRYALKHFWGDEAVGVLTFFLFIRGAIQSLIESGVVFILQPRIVAARQTGRLDEYRRLMRHLALGVFGVALGLSAVAALLIRPALWLIGRPEYGREMSAFWTVLALTIVAALSDIPHTALYARNLDRAIITAALLGLAAALFANLALVPALGIAGAVAATMCGFAVMGLYSAWVLRRAGPPVHAS